MRDPRGFTLIEMIVVLSILGLIAGIVITRGPSRSPTLEVQQAVIIVAQAMRGARAAAIAAEKSTDVEIDTVAHSVRAGSAATRLLPATVAVAAVTAAGTPLPARYVAIRFAADGSSSGGSVVLAEGLVRMVVVVDWLTGRVRSANAP